MVGPLEDASDAVGDREAGAGDHRRRSGTGNPAPLTAQAVPGSDAAALRQWAEGLRADLARLRAHLRGVQGEADAAGRRVDVRRVDGGGGPGRAEVLPLLDRMLGEAQVRVEAASKAARAAGEVAEPGAHPSLP